eukprot:scaffold5578_cov68-Cylindrotheca_fusiformis.AAC.1
MLLAIDEALAGDGASRKREIGRVIRKFEQKDILSILELFLWKVKIDEIISEEQTVDREFCRVHSGASIVIPHMNLQTTKKTQRWLSLLAPIQTILEATGSK